MKGKWQKPELIVLQRAKAEELVLTACKRVTDTGPGDLNTGCYNIAGVCSCCDECTIS